MTSHVPEPLNMRNHYVVRVATSPAPSVDVTAEGYSVRTWRTKDGGQAWWITWDEAPSALETVPEKNAANGLLVVADGSGRVEISADRFGTTPAFYRQDQDGLLISNVFDAVASGLSSEPDEIGFWELVLFETPLTDRTLLKRVRYLSAGTTLTFTPGRGLQTRRYWNYTFDALDVKTDEECAMLCGEVLEKALRPYASMPVIRPISGGLEGRLRAATLQGILSQRRVTGVT
ncbi:MAG: hypothetical protein K8R46_09180 [Pirellulales bacterium]|nr:hypothetical protein [Pirellulales bacterium]